MSEGRASQDAPAPLFPKGYWERPPLNPIERGDQCAEAIYCAVGHSLSMWEIAENALADVFLIMSDCNTTGAYLAARRAFGAIETSSGRRRMLGEVAPVYFGGYWSDPVVSKPFRKLSDAFSDASHRRDDIAHGIAMGISVNNDELGIFLVPAEYNSARNRLNRGIVPGDPFASMPGIFRYTAATITGYANKFLELRNKTIEYMGIMRKIGGVPAQILVARGIDPAQFEVSLPKQ